MNQEILIKASKLIQQDPSVRLLIISISIFIPDLLLNVHIYFLGSPSKDFSARVSDQLNALRTLLETHLIEPDETKRQTKDLPILQSSPGTFARDFLQSSRPSSFKNTITEYISDSDDDDKEVARSFNKNNINEKPQDYGGHILSSSTTSSNQHGYTSRHHYEQILQPNLSSLSNEINPAKVSSTAATSSISTITSNLADKIDTRMLKSMMNFL
jgi:hypothetical protein